MAMFDFIFQMDPLLAITVITFLIMLIITVVYKYTTDQKRMKELRDEQKKVQKEIKDARNDPAKMMKINKKAMQTNWEYMRHSMKSTLYTLIPMFLLFAWLNSHFAYYNIMPNESFNVTAHFKEGAIGTVSLEQTPQLGLLSPAVQNVTGSAVSWTLKGTAGEHFVTINYKEDVYKQSIIISETREYINPVQIVKDSKLVQITTDLKKVQPFGNISLFGWKPGWFATYFFLSLLFSMGLRKVMKVY